MSAIDTKWSGWRLIFGLMLGFALVIPNAQAFVQPGPTPPGTDANFEIDVPSANALDDPAYAGDDWETVYRCAVGGSSYDAAACSALGGLNSNFVGTSGIISDPAPASIYTTGGSKDINDVSQWRWKDGAVPDKDNILHAGAVAYESSDADGNQLLLYLFADRYANDGDALMGAWFFQNEVTKNPNGTFSGVHKNGDIVWFGNFSGGGVVASLEIDKWNDPGLPGYDAACAANSAPTLPYQVGHSNLCVIAMDPTGGAGAGYFASVNTKDETSPWSYTPKQGNTGFFPYNSFFEGGINITQLLGTTPCFSSFLIESRSSTSESAQLKDFVLGNINTCKISVTKECSSVLAADNASIDDTFKIYVKNEGFANITSVTLDDTNPATAQDKTVDLTSDPITSGENQLVDTYTINTTTQNLNNTVTAVGHAGSADTAPATYTAVCPSVTTTAKLVVTKDCDKTQLTVDNRGTASAADDRLNVEVFYSGMVCNAVQADAVKLFDVAATEVHNGLPPGPLTLTFPVTSGQLAVGDCATFTGSYFPNAVTGSNVTALNASPCTGANPNWTDTVNASATGALGTSVTVTNDSATCPLVCPYPSP